MKLLPNVKNFEDIKGRIFHVSRKTFNKTSKLSKLTARPDKRIFLDSVVFGALLLKKVNIEAYKSRIRKQLLQV